MKKEALILSAFMATATGVFSQQRQTPNIIFILCDDMGYGDLGCYGQRLIETPNIDRMASEGMRFTQAYAGSPVSAPSRATLMTGQHSGHTHVRGNKEYWTQADKVMYGENPDFAVTGIRPVCLVNGREVTKARGLLLTSGEWMNITDISVSFKPTCIIRIS